MRPRRIWIAVGVGVLACIVILLAVLPIIVRRVAVGQIATLTARATAIDEARLTQRVADFLRASKFLKLSLQPMMTDADVASLATQEVTARIQRVQRSTSGHRSPTRR